MNNLQDCIFLCLTLDPLNNVDMTQSIIKTPINLKHPNVRRVIEIAEEIISENHLLTLDKLFKRAKRILKIPSSGLKTIIQFLVNKKILVDQSRFTSQSVISNPIRKEVYSIISHNPGIHISAVRKLIQEEGLSLGVGQLLWHIDMLLKFGCVKSVNVGNFLILIPTNISNEYGIICFLFRDELNKSIIELICIRTQIKQSEVYKILNESRELVYYHIKKLIEYEILLLNDIRIIKINPNFSRPIRLKLKEDEVKKFYKK